MRQRGLLALPLVAPVLALREPENTQGKDIGLRLL